MSEHYPIVSDETADLMATSVLDSLREERSQRLADRLGLPACCARCTKPLSGAERGRFGLWNDAPGSICDRCAAEMAPLMREQGHRRVTEADKKEARAALHAYFTDRMDLHLRRHLVRLLQDALGAEEAERVAAEAPPETIRELGRLIFGGATA